MIAALYVERGGPYFGRFDVDPWDRERDARRYAGPWPVVAHPPCGPWGNLRHLVVPNRERLDDADCGPIAINQVRRFGGVLEQPAGSKLFDACDCAKPGDPADRFGGIAIEVAQVEWGHPARKRTWLYLVGVTPVVRPPYPGRAPTHWVSGGRNPYRKNGKSGGGASCRPASRSARRSNAAARRRRSPSG